MSEEEKKRIKRRNIAQEIYETEEKYSCFLRTIISEFRNPLQDGGTNGKVTQTDVQTIFQNIEEIRKSSQKLLDLLDQNNLHDKDSMGEIFISMVDDLHVYKKYCDAYDVSQGHLELCMRSNAFAKLIKQHEKAQGCQKQALKDLLILPVQRLTRYPLLLNSLLEATPIDHPDHHSLKQAIAGLSELTMSVNELKKMNDEKTQALSLMHRIDSLDIRDINSRCTLIMEVVGKMVVTHKSVTVFLLNDRIIIAETKVKKSGKSEKLDVIEIVNLTLVEVENVEGCKNKELIDDAVNLVGFTQVDHKKAHIIKFEEEDKKKLVTAIKSILHANKQAPQPVVLTPTQASDAFQFEGSPINSSSGHNGSHSKGLGMGKKIVNKLGRRLSNAKNRPADTRGGQQGRPGGLVRSGSVISIYLPDHESFPEVNKDSLRNSFSSGNLQSQSYHQMGTKQDKSENPKQVHQDDYSDDDSEENQGESAKFTMITKPSTGERGLYHRSSIKRRPSQKHVNNRKVEDNQNRRSMTFPSYTVLTLDREEAYDMIYKTTKETVEQSLKVSYPDEVDPVVVKLRLTPRPVKQPYTPEDSSQKTQLSKQYSVGDDDVINYPMEENLGSSLTDLKSLKSFSKLDMHDKENDPEPEKNVMKNEIIKSVTPTKIKPVKPRLPPDSSILRKAKENRKKSNTFNGSINKANILTSTTTATTKM